MMERPNFNDISQIMAQNSKRLKNCRKIRIPEIKIQLDQMLTDAYAQLRCQPKKSFMLGKKKDIYVLDNNVLQQYINGVYLQYTIPDPMATQQFLKQNTKVKKIRSRSNNQSHQQQHLFSSFQTPKKNAHFISHGQNTTQPKLDKKYKKLNTGKYNIESLKKKFKSQLNSQVETQHIQAGYLQMQQKSSKQRSVNPREQRKFPIVKNEPKRLKVRLSRNSTAQPKFINNRSTSVKAISLQNSVQKTQQNQKAKSNRRKKQCIKKFCLYCQKQIVNMSNQKHFQQCRKFLSFIRIFIPKLPPLQAMRKLTQQKLEKISKQLLEQSSNFKEQASLLQSAIKKYVNKQQHRQPIISLNSLNSTPIKSLKLSSASISASASVVGGQSGVLLGGHRQMQNISRIVQQSRMLQCYRIVQKYEYFREISSYLGEIHSRDLEQTQSNRWLDQYLGFRYAG